MSRSNKQKFPKGCRVHIAEKLGECMQPFEAGLDATVVYTLAQKFGGKDKNSYCLYR